MGAAYRLPIVLALPALLLFASAASAQTYKTYNEAMAAGARLLRDQQFAASQAPLEEALKLAATDQQRRDTYQALTPAYRQLPAIDKMLEAKEYLISHTDQKAGRSVNASDLANFAHQRGKTDELVQRYEAKLKGDDEDIVALSVLSVIYSRIKRDANRGLTYSQRLARANTKAATAVAERLEREAETAPRTAAWQLKDAAVAWIEAGDNAKALAAAKKSVAQGPESRTEQLTLYWHEALGDVFKEVGEKQLALKHYTAAAGIPINPVLKKSAEKKLADLKADPGTK
jgi:hypothetical protein